MKKLSYLHLFSFFRVFNYGLIVYAYFAYSTINDDVTKLVTHRVFNTNLQYSSIFYAYF